MKTLGILIAKDFRRTVRNPWPWILNLALPLAITALVGFAFGPRGDDDSIKIARIKVAVVDEDQSIVTSVFRSLLTEQRSIEHLDPIFVQRAEALRMLHENQISAILAFPTNFGSNYIRGATGLKLEVIKNPAQSFMPAIVEELGAVTVSGLNAISRNLNSEFPKIRAATTNAESSERIADIVKRVGDRLKNLSAYIDPPLVSYEKFESYQKPAIVETNATTVSANETSSSPPPPSVQTPKPKSSVFNIFAYILPGMASAFLLFIADQSMRDFHREVRMKTLDRQRTVGAGAGMFVIGKILFTALTVAIAAGILFCGGALTFRIHWNHPGLLALACLGYSLFAAGLMAALSALAPSERRVDVLNSMLLFGIAFLGGSYLPADNFPRFMREHVSTLMPNYWLIESMRALQRSDPNYIAPLIVVLKLTIAGAILGFISAVIIERRLTSGVRA